MWSAMLQLLQKFRRDRRGNVALMFGLAVLPVVMMVGMAIDMTNATRVRMSLQDATDEAAIALARQATTIADNQIYPAAQTAIHQSFTDSSTITVTNATVDRQNIVGTVDASVSVPTTFSQLLGISTMTVTTHAVAKGLLLEISLVLDTSGSMADSAGTGGSKIAALRTASSSFLDAMFGTDTTSQRVAVAVVPFATNVRVAAAGSTPPTWMDTGGLSPDAYDDFDVTTRTRFQMFAYMKSQSWGGCVMTRPSPYDVTDATPTTTVPATLFVPWFAPDEPDTNLSYGQSGYENDYISDTGGACSGSTSGKSDLWRQQRTCKYKSASPASGLGPNFLCDSQAITPLTSTRSTLNTAVGGLQAAGDTNILEGITWGWRTLSPNAPFTEGKSYTAPNNRKIIILMTDGMNNYNGVNNPNMSYYFTYGFAKDGRIGQTTSNNTTLTTLLDAKTLQACTNAKNQGILIYTIGFGSGASGSANLLRGCASDPTDYYTPQNSSDLQPVFQQIAQSINSLRIAQ